VRGRLIAFAVLATSAGHGCGGTSEEEQARDVVKEYAAAIADGNERKVCAALSKESKRRFDRAKTTCEDAYEGFGEFLGASQKDKLKRLDPQVSIQGNEASTSIDQPPLEGKLRLKKEGGEWKISTR
jgi:hypothetical protein